MNLLSDATTTSLSVFERRLGLLNGYLDAVNEHNNMFKQLLISHNFTIPTNVLEDQRLKIISHMANYDEMQIDILKMKEVFENALMALM